MSINRLLLSRTVLLGENTTVNVKLCPAVKLAGSGGTFATVNTNGD